MNPRSKTPEPGVEPAEVRAQLTRLLDSPPFRTSRRCSDFLRHVVEGTVEGRGEGMKERTLGVAVFDRAPDYDTNQDPVVRNTAGQVRKRLAQYYCEPGREQELRIDLPPGSYVAEVYRPVETEAVLPAAVPAVEAKARWRQWVAAGVLAIGAGLGVWWWTQRTPATTLAGQFWAPLVQHAGPVVLCVGQGHTYKLGAEWDRRFEDAAANGGKALGRASVPVGDVIPSWDRHVGLNDAQALMRFTALFTRYGKEVELRGGRSTSLQDLRRRPVVLVGAFNNDWTLNLTGELRFYFESDPAGKLDMVRDRLHPEKRSWAVRSDVPVNQVTTDYAIVTRVFNVATEQAVVVAAGIKGAGTAAAGEFLTNPDYLNQALSSAPAGWAGKNVQFVLAVKMFSGSPGPASVIAVHTW